MQSAITCTASSCQTQLLGRSTHVKTRLSAVRCHPVLCQQRPDADQPSQASRRGVLKGGVAAGLSGVLGRGFKWLGAAELGAVAEKAAISAAELLAKTSSQLQPTVQHLLKLGLHPADVQAMLRNPALRPRNAAHLQQMISQQGPTLLKYVR